MQLKLTALTTVGVAAVATATGASGSSSNECDTGTLLCCNSTETDVSPATALLLGLLGIPQSSVTGLIGIDCSPVTVIGVGDPSCSAKLVCCTIDSFSGILAVGCTPVSLSTAVS